MNMQIKVQLRVGNRTWNGLSTEEKAELFEELKKQGNAMGLDVTKISWGPHWEEFNPTRSYNEMVWELPTAV